MLVITSRYAAPVLEGAAAAADEQVGLAGQPAAEPADHMICGLIGALIRTHGPKPTPPTPPGPVSVFSALLPCGSTGEGRSGGVNVRREVRGGHCRAGRRGHRIGARAGLGVVLGLRPPGGAVDISRSDRFPRGRMATQAFVDAGWDVHRVAAACGVARRRSRRAALHERPGRETVTDPLATVTTDPTPLQTPENQDFRHTVLRMNPSALSRGASRRRWARAPRRCSTTRSGPRRRRRRTVRSRPGRPPGRSGLARRRN